MQYLGNNSNGSVANNDSSTLLKSIYLAMLHNPYYSTFHIMLLASYVYTKAWGHTHASMHARIYMNTHTLELRALNMDNIGVNLYSHAFKLE